MDTTPYEALDHLMTLDARVGDMPRGFIHRLYRAARGEGEPLTFQATKKILELPAGLICIFTGVVIAPTLPRGEIDGPVGAVTLARSLNALGHEVAVVVPEAMVEVVEGLAERLGLTRTSVVPHGEFVNEIAPRRIREIVAGITIEKLGRNQHGVRHSVMGIPIHGDDLADEFIESLSRSGVLTIGIGDGGNEVGFGRLHEVVRQVVPRADDCGCPCGGGTACSTAVDVLLTANISNLGAYALGAAFALQTGDISHCVEPQDLENLLRDALRLGCPEGVYRNPEFVGDDGVPLATLQAWLLLMKGVVTLNAQSCRGAY